MSAVDAGLRRVRPLVRPLVVALVVVPVALFLGVHVRDTALIAAVVFVLVLVASTLDAGEEYVWPADDAGASDGTRRDVTALTWTFFGRDGRVSEAAVRRLREDARRRLARHGVHLPGGLAAAGTGVNPPDDERRARVLLGDHAWRSLTGHGGWLPSLSDVQHVVDVLEYLAATDPSPTGRTAP